MVLALCSVAVAPVAAVGSEDADSGSTVAGTLSDGDGSDDSTDSGTDGSADGGSTDDSTGTSGDGSTDDSTGTSGDRTFDDSSSDSDGESDDSFSDGEEAETLVTESTDAVDDAVGFGTLSDELSMASVATDGADGTTTAVSGGEEVVPLTTLDAFDGAAVSDTTGAVSASALTGKQDALLGETVTALSGVGGGVGPMTDATGPVRDGVDPVRPDVDATGTDAPSSNALALGERGPAGSTPAPAGPTTGLALGVGAVAAAAVTRRAAVTPQALVTFASTLTAGVAPLSAPGRTLDRLLRTVAPFRYSRYDDSDPLEHDARADVYEVVDETPGAYLSEVAERADLPLSTVRHHVRVLEREDLVSGAKVRGKRRFYPAYTQGVELAAALEEDATAAVIDAIARFGAASVSDIADELGRDPSTVSHHLSRLAEDGIVVREREGRAVMNKLAPEARTALEPSHDAPSTESGEALASD
ncbi:winged helix-turn-helix transcriptional regulator [Halorarius halobius]|uniref:winged helix-turn-helix transcriptional regulator n=1 Tax=Halorarius halobius TaxID=2962671 RepID=UPI0020CC0915|nr:helix-turn-helix domain-containing protein [Halorarius halobius]